MAMFHLLKIRTSVDIFKNEKCKVSFGLKYTSTLSTCVFLFELHSTLGSIEFRFNHEIDMQTRAL